jgi:hypothetical protein
MNRSCQRDTQGFETPARRMISAVPAPLCHRRNDPRPPHMRLWGLLRSATTAANRSRSAAPTSMLIPSRMAHHDTRQPKDKFLDRVVTLASWGLFPEADGWTSGYKLRIMLISGIKQSKHH